MQSHLLLTLSLTGNALLTLALLCPWSAPRPQAAAAPAAVASSIPTLPCPAPANPPAPDASDSSSAAFHWSRLQIDDYRAYARNLRAIGCPEPTVQDIIAGCLHRDYRTAQDLRNASSRYWESCQRRTQAEADADTERERQARALKEEKALVFRELFGTSITDHVPASSAGSHRRITLLDQFRPAVRAQADDILHRYERAERDVIDRVHGTLGRPELDELDALYWQQHAELELIISPAELEEFELRASPLAKQLRNADLIGFSPTEEEFRTIYRIQKQAENESSAGTAEATDLARQAGEARLRQALGEPRFRDYQRAQDLDYRRLVELSDFFGLSQEPAMQVHDLRAAFLDKVSQLSQASYLDPDTRLAHLKNLQFETEQRVASLLGSDAYAQYASLPDSDWLRRIDIWTNALPRPSFTR